MHAREIAGAAGLGKLYFTGSWSRPSHVVRQLRDIQDRTKSIFIHIPKTAGMSVWKSLYDVEGIFGHPPAWAFRLSERQRFDDYFSFAILRDPIDRFISAFYFLKANGLTSQDMNWGQEKLSPYETPNDLVAAMASPIVRGKIVTWKHFIPQTWYVTDLRGRVIVDYLGTVENFDHSMQEIAQRIGVELHLARKNVTKRRREAALTEASIDRLHEVYEEDFKLYEQYAGHPDVAEVENRALS